MPRPKVDRVARSMRLPADVDAALVAEAEKLGLSINEAIERAVLAWTTPRVAKRQVEPRFKRK